MGLSSEQAGDAPGQPGIAPTWTSSAKDMVGCALGPSRVWFTLGFGIVNEVYYPRVDIPQIRDLGFIVADKKGFWTEVKRLQNYTFRLLAPGTPAVEIVHSHERFSLKLRITPDPDRDVLLIEMDLDGDPDLRPYVLAAPRLGTSGHDNIAEIVCRGKRRILTARQGPFALALAARNETHGDGFGAVSAGYVGVSDGWQDFNRNGVLAWHYDRAGPGNIAVIGELSRKAVVALGFGMGPEAAATLAISSLTQPVKSVVKSQIDAWEAWHSRRKKSTSLGPEELDGLSDQFLLSSMVLRCHRDKGFPGTMVASLSVPWGNSRDDRGGYHLVWPRDLVECATAFLALGAEREARNTLRHLIATQQKDGNWSQNQWIDGTPYWQGIQLDETAFPVLLAAALAERNALADMDVKEMVLGALCFIAQSGPSSAQDRWEENAGINTFTLSVCIAAMVAGAQFLDEPPKTFALALADFWNAHLESWLTVSDTALARRLGIGRYYVRLAPPEILGDPSRLKELLDESERGDEEISTDFLQLVRMGLRGPDDPCIRDSVTAIDAMLKVETENGPSWHRYNGDSYGEHDDGAPFDGSGKGRAWPLLTGERGHYELVRGADPLPYLKAMAAMTGPGGMIPEQIWDSAPLPARGLLPGHPTGSAMPLAWAHAEFVKLTVSRHLKYPFDRPASVWQRYGGKRPEKRRAIWRPNARIGTMERGVSLMIALPGRARIHWGTNGWHDVADCKTEEFGLGFHGVELDAGALASAHEINFTFQWRDTEKWAGEDFRIRIAAPGEQ